MGKVEYLNQLLSFTKGETLDNLDLFSYGFGSLSDLYKAYNLTGGTALEKEVIRSLKSKYGEDGAKSFLSSLLTSYYTPNQLCDQIVNSLPLEFYNDNLRVLEPAAGTGNFIPAILKKIPGAQITAIEKDAVAFDFLSKKFSSIDLRHGLFEETTLTDKYDLVISNFPFGDYKIFDPEYSKTKNAARKKSTATIHNYFALKSYDQLKDGGLLVFITTSKFSDSPNNKIIREELVRKGNLKFFNRLPTNVFNESGTKVSADIIIIEKNLSKELSQVKGFERKWINSRAYSKGINVNELLSTTMRLGIGNSTIGGLYGNNQIIFESNESVEQISSTLGSRLHNAFNGFNKTMIRSRVVNIDDSPAKHIESKSYLHLKDYHQEGSLIFHQGKLGKAISKGEFHPDQQTYSYEFAALSSSELKEIPFDKQLDYAALKQTVLKLYYERDNLDSKSYQELLAHVNMHYDKFTFRHGYLSSNLNSKLLKLDPLAHVIKSIEIYDPKSKTASKSDLLTNPDFNNDKETVDKLSITDALILSINKKGKIDLDLMSKHMHSTNQDVLEEGISKKIFYYDIISVADDDKGQHIDYNLTTKDEFLSGNITNKIRNHESIQRPDLISGYVKDIHLESLRRIAPAKLAIESLDIHLGERWIDTKIFEDFCQHLLDVDTNVHYLQSSDDFKITAKNASSKNGIEYSSPSTRGKYLGIDMVRFAMIDATPSITKTIYELDPTTGDNKEKKVPDYEKIKKFQMKIKTIKSEWNSWITSNEKVRTYLEDTYHEKFNSEVIREYDGSILDFSDISHYKPRITQKNGVLKFTQELGGIGDHKTGAGKTLIMVMNAIRAKRLGLVKKPMIIGLKSNTSAIIDDFEKAYPGSKVLGPSETDFRPEKRKELLAKIMTNDWDCIVLTHDQFGMIPQDPNFEKSILNEQIKALESDLYILSEDSNISKRQLKGLEKRKLNLEARVKEITHSIKKDHDVVNFKQMGVDFLQVDEAHEFKNLMFTTRSTNVSGLGNPQGSKKALNLLIACRTIQDHWGEDKGIALFTATPLANSIVEMYTWYNYLQPQLLRSRNINSFDAWASMYAEKSSEFEFSVTGEIKLKERFREFVKVPELVRDYHKMAHVVTKRDLDVNEPELESLLIDIEPTEEQLDYNERLIQFANSQGRDGHLINKSLSDSSQLAYMLIATNEARKMSTDIRLVEPDTEYSEQSKLGVGAHNIAQKYKEFDFIKGTQFAFCDIATPGSKTSSINFYQELKNILVNQYQIPENEIQFIHDYKTRKKRTTLLKEFNEGNVRILMGSTSKMGVGVNGQERVVAMHHFDIKWRPLDFEQRNGRGARTGNWVAEKYNQNKVQNFVYATKRTLDAYQFQVNQTKQNFISQIKHASMKSRRIDEGGIDGEGAMNYAEFVALVSGNTQLLEKSKLDRKLSDLKNERDIFYSTKQNAVLKIEATRNSIDRLSILIDQMQKQKTDFDFWFSTAKGVPLDERTYNKPVIINGQSFNSHTQITKALTTEIFANKNKIRSRLSDTGHVERDTTSIGSFIDFNIEMVRFAHYQEQQISSSYVVELEISRSNEKAKHNLTYQVFVDEGETPCFDFNKITNKLSRLNMAIDNAKIEIGERQQDLVSFEKISKEEYQGNDQIVELEKKIEEITEQIAQGETKEVKKESSNKRSM